MTVRTGDRAPAKKALPAATLAKPEASGDKASALRHFMDDLHLPMPTYRFRPAEQDDIIAYILSLKSRPAGMQE